MKQEELIQLLEQIAPPEIADDFDNGRIGMILDLLYTKNREVKKIAVTLDVTNNVLQKAADFGADILICHHTPLFHPIMTIPEDLAKRLKIAFDNNISIYAMHTNYDNADGGINTVLADMFGLKETCMTDFGIIGTVTPIETEEFVKKVSEKLNTPLLYAGDKTIRKVMICGGSCLNRHALSIAKANSVDAFLSSELKHSDVLRERGDMTIIDAGHYATENPGMRVLAQRLEKEIGSKTEILFIDDNPELKSI
ncbi:GTP cyclohydrolase 1 type 2 [Methanimicrococcus sp. At1]|uniref:GTP cyclohydrolase 1 type 2 n=1 Tax=Methanimicrococcus hacksteinii TaxID=3028293 RepID=A0ABU3VN77_9EURY|nr:Nif3-like dinuclear metal center hexameric protein [Methanimicrococcus sp. At1]MDV0444847.1 GTP cyclohydrolase 1 type 2 [Methanimicrococcus sp. At1]